MRKKSFTGGFERERPACVFERVRKTPRQKLRRRFEKLRPQLAEPLVRQELEGNRRWRRSVGRLTRDRGTMRKKAGRREQAGLEPWQPVRERAARSSTKRQVAM